MENSGFIDILILAMIAAFLVFRLRSALGRRTGHQRPQDRFSRDTEDSGDTVVHLPERGSGDAAPHKAPDGEPESAAEEDEAAVTSPEIPGLTELQDVDPDFGPDEFLEGARIAFEMILDAYASGDKDQMRALLADDVLERFVSEIDNRAQARRTLESTLVSFVSVSIETARIEGRSANVTVRFVTEQINLLRDEDGNAVEGDGQAVTQLVDVWTFERDLRSRDPNWRLVETGAAD